MKLVLTAYQARLLYLQLCSLLDSGAETLDQKEIDALDDIVYKLTDSAGVTIKTGGN